MTSGANVATLLVADDDDEDYALLLKQLNHRFNVLRARDGREALKLLEVTGERRVLPTAIILDLSMPKLDGGETLRHIRRDQRFDRVPTVILSSCATREIADGLRAAGADACLAKPFGRCGCDRLLALIDRGRPD